MKSLIKIKFFLFGNLLCLAVFLSAEIYSSSNGNEKPVLDPFGKVFVPDVSFDDHFDNDENEADEDTEDYIIIKEPDEYNLEFDGLTKRIYDNELNIKNGSFIKNNTASNVTFEKIVSSDMLNKLKRKLLQYYDVNSRPMYDNSKSMTVKLSVGITQINHLDALYQVHNIFY